MRPLRLIRTKIKAWHLAWRRYRFARACAKLDPREEKMMAEEGMEWELELWDDY
jgi:hypothetical protein